MSVDTRTPRTPTGDRSSALDDAPALSMVKVPSDPAQVIVNHASFRVQLGVSARRASSPRIARHMSAAEDTARIPVVTTVGTPGQAARRRPVVWSGRSAPDDTGAHRLLQAVRHEGVRPADERLTDSGATRLVPRPGTGYDDPVTQTLETPLVGAQRGPADGPLLPPMRPVGSAYDEPAYAGPDDPAYDSYGSYDSYDESEGTGRRGRRHGGDDPARHAYYPGRRMNLGVVLLPLRVFLGGISVYAGMGKLCDPLYFDGGQRGSMVKWLHTLHPWEVAEPLRQFALEHPIGSGLAIAFAQIVVGVLTVLGCWQRVAAVVGATLSAALLVTVSWKSVPAYETPDIIYLAAWSPLIIAGAPVYSVDGRLAGGAWRRLGPRADIWDLRRYVLRRGALVAFVVCGFSMLAGSLLGGAVRDTDRVVVPGPGEAPRNELPGSPLPDDSGERPKEKRTPSASTSPTQGATSGTASPSAGTTSPGATQGAGAATTGAPGQTQGSTGQAPPQQATPADQAPSTTSGPTSGGGASGSPSGGSGGTSGEPGLVGGLLG
ncbi:MULTISPECIES: DoxX family membrane protein [Streptomyces]|uniref:DoxX family membrane protein n=1 Tax=Streptomyces edwardsiae TaxID=3075527 RepID=A0ABU2PZF9_9ACTN|nr:DoxX family membrane protein [Streptomyces sp. DSM 41636]MDT0397568.1 DoxX family membrane protein [Streptomyces sp. DSM 41636]